MPVIDLAALVVKKNLLVYRTNTRHNNFPIFVVSPTELGGLADTQIPIVLCYTGHHFEGLVPSSAVDVEKTALLVQAYEEGRVNVTADEIPILRNQKEERRKEASKVGSHKRTYAEITASASNIGGPPTAKKTSSVGEPPNPSTATQRDKPFLSPAKSGEKCKVCQWEGKSLMAHLRNKKLRCSDEYDMVAERESRAKGKNFNMTGMQCFTKLNIA